ncbi:hypothetical protein C8Q80DRAFT_124378 [Daedaleopsis nitida]|nr:hypothetical protein C8Q80DRAFT_124378 [Daedaleopsis nitida]
MTRPSSSRPPSTRMTGSRERVSRCTARRVPPSSLFAESQRCPALSAAAAALVHSQTSLSLPAPPDCKVSRSRATSERPQVCMLGLDCHLQCALRPHTTTRPSPLHGAPTHCVPCCVAKSRVLAYLMNLRFPDSQDRWVLLSTAPRHRSPGSSIVLPGQLLLCALVSFSYRPSLLAPYPCLRRAAAPDVPGQPVLYEAARPTSTTRETHAVPPRLGCVSTAAQVLRESEGRAAQICEQDRQDRAARAPESCLALTGSGLGRVDAVV